LQNKLQSLGLHVNASRGFGHPLGFWLGADIHHMGLAAFVEM
jgi:hypothetical protein